MFYTQNFPQKISAPSGKQHVNLTSYNAPILALNRNSLINMWTNLTFLEFGREMQAYQLGTLKFKKLAYDTEVGPHSLEERESVITTRW